MIFPNTFQILFAILLYPRCAFHVQKSVWYGRQIQIHDYNEIKWPCRPLLLTVLSLHTNHSTSYGKISTNCEDNDSTFPINRHKVPKKFHSAPLYSYKSALYRPRLCQRTVRFPSRPAPNNSCIVWCTRLNCSKAYHLDTTSVCSRGKFHHHTSHIALFIYLRLLILLYIYALIAFLLDLMKYPHVI